MNEDEKGKRQNIGYCTHQNYHDIITFCKEISLDFIFYDRAIIYVRGESKKINDFLKSFDRLRVESWHNDALEVIYIHKNNNEIDDYKPPMNSFIADYILDVRTHPEKYPNAEKFLEFWDGWEIKDLMRKEIKDT